MCFSKRKTSSGLIQEGSGSEETNELAFIIMICSGVSVAILLAGFLWNQYKITLIIPGKIHDVIE